MDLHLLIEARKRSTRHQVNQQAKQQYLGRESASTQSTRHWSRRLARVMQEVGLGRKGGAYDPYAGYRRQIFEIFTQMAKTKGEQFMASLSDQQLKKAVRLLAHNISMIQDVPSKDPKISSITTGRYGGVLTKRAGHVDADGNAILEPPGGEGKGVTVRHSTQNIPTQRMNMGDLEKHDNPYLQNIHTALRQDKHAYRNDSSVVFSADNKPFYILGHVSKTVKIHEGPKGEYELLLPRARDYRSKPLPTMLETLDFSWWSNWKAEYRTENFSKLGTVKSRVFDEEFIKKAQTSAWEKAKPFYLARNIYKQFFDLKEAIQKKYYRQGMMRTPSEQDQKQLELFSGVLNTLDRIMAGGNPAIDPRIKTKVPGVFNPKAIREGFTWLLWLMACEGQFGILNRERQALPELANKPKTKSATQPPITQSTIQPAGREEIPTWNLSALSGIGFRETEMQAFENALKKAKYAFGNQGNRAITHLWVPQTDLERLSRTIGLKLHPANISDYLHGSKKSTRTEYIVGRENDAIKVDKKLPFAQYNFKVGNTDLAMVPAVEFLKHFDSPSHGGDRFVHGLGVVPAKLPTRSYYDRRMLTDHPNLLAPKGSFIYDPEKREQEIKKIADNLQNIRFKREKDRVQANTAARKRIEQRKGLIFVSPGKKPFSGFTRWGGTARTSSDELIRRLSATHTDRPNRFIK